MDATGAHPVRLTNSSATDTQPVWSPDGTKILFNSWIAGYSDIYVMNADGSNQTRLTNAPVGNFTPAWSPDGTKIAFTSDRDGNDEVYVMNADGSNPTRLTFEPQPDFDPDWSPDGKKIAFGSFRNRIYEIFVMDADGSNQFRLTVDEVAYGVEDGTPAWSPDGTKVAFTSSREQHNAIWVMDADGTNPIRLSDPLFTDASPRWSPDGTRIVYRSLRGEGYNEIYVMNADGSNQTPLTNDWSEDYDPDWQRVPQALNISTRMRVDTGDNVLIGGFIVTGTTPKNVVVRGIGPSLSQAGIGDVLADPTLELHDGSGALLVVNDNWQDDPAQAAQLTALGLGLQHPNESGLVASLQPDAYTAVLAGNGGGTGVGLVEVYDISGAASSQLANMSTRGFVLAGDNVMIGGFILGGNNNDVVARGIGPSLAAGGLSPVLEDPTLELHDGSGTLLVANDDWQDDDVSASRLAALGLAPGAAAESGIYVSLPLGAFTAVLAGKNGGTGIGLVEIYNLH
jgi:Tol biopolymer transport system component